MKLVNVLICQCLNQVETITVTYNDSEHPDLKKRKKPADGNCFYYALSDALTHMGKLHSKLEGNYLFEI